jgi:Reverse transcriptase (RNA-dependent DNA polymerase)
MLLSLFKSYLTNRKQCVRIGDETSGTIPMIMGIPQGSILGPLLFNIYINDISLLAMKGNLKLFADDCVIFYRSKSVVEAVREMNEAYYYYLNKITLNASKTKYVIFSAVNKVIQTHQPPSFQGESIERVSHIKYLGLTLDQNMTWMEHIRQLRLKISPYVGLLCRLKYSLPSRMLKLIYSAYISSNLLYLVMIWGAASSSHLKPLQTLQNRALKQTFGKCRLYPTIDLYTEVASSSRILPIKAMYEYQLCCYMFKTTKGLQHANIAFQTPSHGYETRGSNNLICRRPRTRSGSVSFSYAGPYTFNMITTQVGNPSSLSQFKALIYEYMSSVARISHYIRPIR